jgi:hypothetical protein
MSGDRKRASERRLEQLRALRSEHFIERTIPEAAEQLDPAEGSSEATATPVPPPPQQRRAPVPESTSLDTAQVKYEMELADHRQTMARLLAEKDETIGALKELVDELRRQLGRTEDADAPTPEKSSAPVREPRPLFDFYAD